MRLNLDCVRDILLCAEENTGLYKSCYFVDFGPPGHEDFIDDDITVPPYQLDLSKKYSNEELIYHVQYCIDSGLLADSDYITNERIQIEDLSPSGHEFIANIRSEKNFTWLKKTLAKVGSDAIPVAMQLIADHVLGIK